MILYHPERLNKRDHWPPGLPYPGMSNVCGGSISLPTDSMRYFLNNWQVGDPQISFIL
jgi:hypothetical protein